MRSRNNLLALLLTAVLLSAVLAAHAQSPQATLPVADGEQPTAEQLATALETVQADPNITPKEKVRVLRWVDKPVADTKTPKWLRWIRGLFRWTGDLFGWLATSGRALLWVAAAVLAAMLVIYLLRVIRARGLPLPERFVPPSHVRDLDIRPESLPDDIGAAARALWDSGEHRAALALLYRGLLSRLVHVHGVPIRDSSTEGDCLSLAEPRLSEERHTYVTHVVRVWQRAVYGAEQVATPVVHSLCEGFAAALDRATAAPGPNA